MKTLNHFALMLIVFAAGPARATITVLDYWHMGENDPGAVSGGYCTNTVDVVGEKTLTNSSVGGLYPTFTNGVSLAASAETGSTLALSLTNGQYGTALLATNLTDNFGIECWVNPGTNATGGHVLAYNGLRGNGWGLYQGGTNYEVLYGGEIFFGSASAPMNTWMHLALVRNNGVAILYTNGVPAATNSSTPITPAGSFTVGGDASFGEYFTGAIDEVRVFTFAPGAFSPGDLLLNSTNLLVSNTNDLGAGSLRNAVADAAPGSTITFTPNLSGQTILLTNGQIELSNNVVIDASALPGGMAINGNNQSRIFQVDSGVTAVLNSLTVTNGDGGIYNEDGTLTLNNCTLAGNHDASDYGGGGVLNELGTLTLNNCTVGGNQANNGGDGGGVYNFFGTLILYNSTFTGNSAANGGAIEDQEFDVGMTMVQCTVVQNHSTNLSADYGGGGGIDIIIDDPVPRNLTSCVVAGNTSLTTNGPDIWAEPGASAPATNCLIGDGTSSTVVNGVNGNQVGSSGSPINPLLAPLGNYGGPTQTMPPLPGSPAINAGGPTSLTTDQRGYPRTVDGATDIGAVELQTPFLVVTTNSDNSTPGSLRNIVARADTGSTITFTNTLSGQVITLTNGQIVLSNNVDIDASALTNGIQINGNGISRAFEVTSATVLLNSLIITNGNDDNDQIYGGGGILNLATLIVTNCTFAGNQATNGYGGGIENEGALTVNSSTFTGNLANSGGGGGIDNYQGILLTVNNSAFTSNQASQGGAINNPGEAVTVNGSSFNNNQSDTGGGIFTEGMLSVNNCTFYDNLADGSGGGIYQLVGALVVNNCTLAGNQAPGSAGGGIYNGDTLDLTNSIVCSNTAVSGANIFGSINAGASNLVDTDAQVAPLGNYGGPTQTMPPLSGSPAIDMGAATSLTTDQRGYPRPSGAGVDIGAVEVQVASAPFVLVGTNGAAGTIQRLANGPAQIDFTNLLGGSFTVFASTNVALPFNTWSNLGPAVETPVGSGQFQFTDPQATNYSKRFYRVSSP